MGRSKQEQVQNTNQTTQQAQTTTQSQEQQQRQLQAQNQSTKSLQNFLQNYSNNFGSSQAGQTTTNLPSFQQPVVGTFFNDLMKQYSSGALAPEVYTGPRVAQATPAELRARQLAETFASGQGTDFSNSALGASNYLLDPNQILNPANIPGLQATKDANARALTRNLTETQLPAVRGAHLLDNTYGSSRQGIAEGLATGRTNEAIANANAGLDMGVYNAGLQAMQNAISMAPQTYAVGTAPAQTVAAVGADQRADEQANIAAQRALFEEQQAQPTNELALLRNLMGVAGEFGGTSSSTGSTTGTESGQQQSTQVAQQLASMLGINLADLTAMMNGTATSSGSTQGTSRTTQTNTPSALQNLAAIASIAMMPFTFGLSGAGAAAAAG